MLLNTIKQVVKNLSICRIPIFEKGPGKLPEDSTRYLGIREDVWEQTRTFELGDLDKQRWTGQSRNYYLLKSFGYGRDRTHSSSQVTYHPTINSNQAEKFSILIQNDMRLLSGSDVHSPQVNKIFQL